MRLIIFIGNQINLTFGGHNNSITGELKVGIEQAM